MSSTGYQILLTGSNPIKKAHPGVHPDGEGSKCPRAKAAEWRPAAALADKHTRITSQFSQLVIDFLEINSNLPMIPRTVHIAQRI